MIHLLHTISNMNSNNKSLFIKISFLSTDSKTFNNQVYY